MAFTGGTGSGGSAGPVPGFGVGRRGTHQPVPTAELGRILNPSHFANRGLKAWWPSLPGLTGGDTLWDMAGVNHLRVAYGQYNANGLSTYNTNGYWSPGAYSSTPGTPRPGAYASRFYGPFADGTSFYAKASGTADINAMCPSGGTIAFWHRPWSTTTGAWQFHFAQGTGTNLRFAMEEYLGSVYVGFYTASTEYRAILTEDATSNWAPYRWDHWAITWGPSVATKVYINGVLASTAANANPSTLPQPLGYFWIGGFQALGKYSQSLWDDFSVWDYQADAARIRQFYLDSSSGWHDRLMMPRATSFQSTFTLPATATGGIGIGSTALPSVARTGASTGGFGVGGKASTPGYSPSPPTTGGFRIGGVRTPSYQTGTIVTVGGFRLGGDVAESFSIGGDASGGFRVCGKVAGQVDYDSSPSGGFRVGGVATSGIIDNGIDWTGGFAIGGVNRQGISPATFGGIGIGGTAADIGFLRVHAWTGGVGFGGKAAAAGYMYYHAWTGRISIGGFLGGTGYGVTDYGATSLGGIGIGAEWLYGTSIYTHSPAGGVGVGGRVPAAASVSSPSSGGIGLGGTVNGIGSATRNATGGFRIGGGFGYGLIYDIFINDGAGGPVDYSAPVASVATTTWTSPVLTYPGDWSFHVRTRDTNTGLREQNTDARKRVILAATTAADVTGTPAAPSRITATPASGGRIRVDWAYRVATGRGRPTEFRVYGGTPAVSYASPKAVVGYTSDGSYSAYVTGLTDGAAYQFVVRAKNAVGEEANTTVAEATADATGPSAPDGFASVLTS